MNCLAEFFKPPEDVYAIQSVPLLLIIYLLYDLHTLVYFKLRSGVG